MSGLRWFVRRSRCALLGLLVCRYRWCGRERVGFSVWCREHTDRIILDHESIDDWPRQ